MVIKFIYFGQCAGSEEDLSEFLVTGEALGVSDLLVKSIDKLPRKEIICDTKNNIKNMNSEQINVPITTDLDTLFDPQGQAVWPTNKDKNNSNVKIIRKEKNGNKRV